MSRSHPVVAMAVEALRQAGAPPELLDVHTPEQLPALFDAATAASDRPTLGLEAGQKLVIRATNPVIYLMMSAPTLQDAFEGLARFNFVLQQRKSRLELGAEEQIRWPASTSGPFTDFTSACLLRLCQWVVGEEIRPQRIRLSRPTPPDPEPYRTFFGVLPEFRSRDNAMALRPADWTRPSAHGDPHLYELHREFLERSQQHLQHAATVQRLREALTQRLGVRSIELADVASEMGCSARTLQRRLRDVDTRFADVLDGVRRERVFLLMKATDASVEAVAGLAGFSDPRSLHRAFVRWTGSTPGAWRAAQSS